MANVKAVSHETGKKTSQPGEQTSNPAKQVCPSCGHTAFSGQFEVGGTRLASYTQSPDENFLISSISAMPIYSDKSHEELRLQDYQMQGTAREQVDRLSQSTRLAQPQLALPIFVGTMMPTYNSGGFGIIPCATTLGSSSASISLTQIGTMPAFASSPAMLFANGITIAPNLRAISGFPTFGGGFNVIPLHHASEIMVQTQGFRSPPVFGYGLPANFGTMASSGTLPVMHHGAPPAPGFGTIPSAPTWGSSAATPSPTAHNGTIPACGTSQATLFGAPCSNTGLWFGQNVGATTSAETGTPTFRF